MNLTIFIITFNRPQFVNLILNYLIKRNFNCDVVIVDGSDKQHKEENLKIIRHFKSIYKNNIKYKFSEKQLKSICSLARKVKTKYCLLSYDDDLPGKEFIDESINFLKNNKNYVTTNGSMATSNIKFKNKKFKISNFKYSDIKISNIYDNKVEKRYLNFNYQEGFAYGLYRKSDFVKIFNIVECFCRVINDPIKKIEHAVSHKLMTITFATYNLLKGNIKSSKKLMMTRLNHQLDQTSSIDYYEKLGGMHINDFYNNNNYYNEILSDQLSKYFKNITKKSILNLIYLHIYMRASNMLPRYFYHVHKSINYKPFTFKEKIQILKNFPHYIYFRILRIIKKINFFKSLVFFRVNKEEIKSIKKFGKY